MSGASLNRGSKQDYATQITDARTTDVVGFDVWDWRGAKGGA